MIYDKDRAAQLLKIVLEVTTGAIDLASRPGGDPSLRIPALEAERVMRTLAAKGDIDAMYGEYLRLLQQGPSNGKAIDRLHHKSFESEFYRFVKLCWDRG